LLGEAGFLWSYLGRWEEAKAVFEALIALAPKDPAGYLGLAELHLSQNEHAEGHKQAEQAVKAAGYPMVLNFVIHRHNIHQMTDILDLCRRLEADYVELATCQYYGWAFQNREGLMPSRAQLETAEAAVNRYRDQLADAGEAMKLIFVTPDYYEERPKACMNGWGSMFLTVAPDGTALPCHSARLLPIEFANVREQSLQSIWYHSPGFNHYRGDG